MNEVLSRTSDGVMHVVLSRPQRKNAITSEMYETLVDTLRRATSDDSVVVVVFSGADGHFTAGNDLDDFIERPPRDTHAPVFRFMRSLALLDKPVIGAVEGMAIGIGTTMLLHFDIVYAATNARFALPFVGLGLVPEAGSSLLLPQLVGHQRAAEKLLLGDFFAADEAQTLGIVNRILAPGEVLPFALQQATRLAQSPVGSVRATKRLMKGLKQPGDDCVGPEVIGRIDDEVRLFVQRVGGPANKEAIKAFKEKRKPNFSGME